jgi:hypothetical protein
MSTGRRLFGVLLLVIGAVTPAVAFEQGKGTGRIADRKAFCAGEPNYKECVNADRGAKKRHFHPDAYEACSELAEYVSNKERRDFERCLAKEDRAIKGRKR